MQNTDKRNIPFLEKPNLEEIEKNINESSIVLNLSLNEKEYISFLSPQNFYFYANRYMYLSNIIPKCLEYFRSSIIPLYGNMCGVYFEINSKHTIKKKVSKLQTFKKNNNKRNNYYLEDNENDIENEQIILDWRIPIGVLFDIYCDFDEIEEEEEEEEEKEEKEEKEKEKEEEEKEKEEEEEEKEKEEEEEEKEKEKEEEEEEEEEEKEKEEEEEEEEKEKEEKEKEKEKEDNPLQKMNKEKRHVVHAVFCTNDKIIGGYDNIVKICSNKKEESTIINNVCKEIDECKKNNKRFSNLEINTNEFTEEKKEAKDSYFYGLIKKKKITNEWYDKQFLKMSKKNIPWKVTICFKSESEYAQWGYKVNSKKNFVKQINLLPYSSCIPLYKNIEIFNEFILNQLTKASHIYKKNSSIIQKLPTHIEKEILFHLKNFNVEKLCALYRQFINYNLVHSVDYFNNVLVKSFVPSNKSDSHSEIIEHAETSEKKGIDSISHLEATSPQNISMNNMKTENNDNIKNASTSSEKIEQNSKNKVFGCFKDENAIEELPIIIHIYGPPYNQVITKFAPFKIKFFPNERNCIEEFYIYTLGDFLHKKFPHFFRKIVKIKNKEHQSMINENNKNSKNDKNKVKRKERKFYTYCDDISHEKIEVIHYYKEGDFLIFSEYVFVIINGIQIPLETPLYWLSVNFSQFDNFLHIILRIPPY